MTFGNYMQVLLTFASVLVAVCVAWTGYQQYRLAAAKLKLELFQKRYAIYKATQQFLSIVLQHGHVEYAQCFEFRRDTQDALFLFGTEVDRYLEDLYKRGIELCSTAHTFEPLPVGPQRTTAVEKNAMILTKLTGELGHLRSVFEPYLGFGNWA